MRPELLVEGQVAYHALARSADSLIGVEIDLFIFETPPQPFDKDVVAPASGPIHTDLNVVSLQEPRKLLAGELAALIRVEDRRGPYRVSASCTASMQKSVVNVLDSRHANTRRLAQFRIAQR